MSEIIFLIIILIVGLLFVGCGFVFIVIGEDNPKLNKLLNLGVPILAIGALIITVGTIVVLVIPYDKVEINRISIAVESIDAYDLNDHQQYKITTEDGTVYDTASSLDELVLSWYEDNNFVTVEESEDNEFHLYNITYQKQSKIGSLTLTDGESTKLVLEIPHKYYVLHTGEQDNNMTRIYTSNE